MTAKRDNSNPHGFIKLGRMSRQIAAAAGIRCADICIAADYKMHIANKHAKEIENLGFSVIDYVKMIVNSFNCVYAGTDDSVLLVVYNPRLSHAAAIRLNYVTKKGVWEVRTAQPRLTKNFGKKKSLWAACSQPR